MLLALAIALGSVAAGAALGALSSRVTKEATGPIQLFALSAAVAVVFAHLLPEAYREVGPASLVAFAIAMGTPLALDVITRHVRASDAPGHHPPGGDASLELGYGGLLVHKVGDGLALGAAAGPILWHHPTGVVVAIAAHTVPLTALVVVAFQGERGTAHALWRAGGLAAAMMAGVVATAAVPAQIVAPWEPWIVAVVAGLVLHVVLHGWRPVRPRSLLGWVTHAAAVLVGLGLVFVGGP